ncbi:MAG: hypothetical protein GY778_07910 [bacterium]|nr:hypothetical protein [bacterium]
MIAKLFPELQRLETKATQRRAFAVAIGEVATRWRYWTAISVIVAGSVYLQFSMPRFGIPAAWKGPARWGIAAVTILACWGLLLSFRRTIRRSLWRTLMDQGIPCCTSCGYDLSGNTSGACPECGATIRSAP